MSTYSYLTHLQNNRPCCTAQDSAPMAVLTFISFIKMEEFILKTRHEKNFIQRVSSGHIQVVASHLRQLLRHAAVDNIDELTHQDVLKYLAGCKSHSTRTQAKNIFKMYLDINVTLPRNILNANGDRVDPNRFLKGWLTHSHATELFVNMNECAHLNNNWPTLLACCVQLGTALRMSDVKKLSRDQIGELFTGHDVTILIGKVCRHRIKYCTSFFMTRDVAKSIIVVNGKPILDVALEALSRVKGELPCRKVSRDFFKRMLPRQTQKFGIKGGEVDYTYGCGFHELRRFTLSYIDSLLQGVPDRAKIVADYADHVNPSSTVRYIQNPLLTTRV